MAIDLDPKCAPAAYRSSADMGSPFPDRFPTRAAAEAVIAQNLPWSTPWGLVLLGALTAMGAGDRLYLRACRASWRCTPAGQTQATVSAFWRARVSCSSTDCRTAGLPRPFLGTVIWRSPVLRLAAASPAADRVPFRGSALRWRQCSRHRPRRFGHTETVTAADVDRAWRPRPAAWRRRRALAAGG